MPAGWRLSAAATAIRDGSATKTAARSSRKVCARAACRCSRVRTA
jgi:hypothetical protein